MSHELIYTSAPRGLKPGSRGFCTVASTPGMVQPLADRLESLSGYRHAFAAHDPQAALNPVNYSHLIVAIAGRKHHVLSRIADAGLDYTQRSNKFAHHVALDPNELTPAGPAWTMQQPGFFETSFSGEPRLLGAGRRPPPGAAYAAICKRWQQTTGDAGWGGVLAETVLAQPQKTVYLLFTPGQELLPLVAEALALLPPERRWQATYSTYFTKLPPGLECQWRFLLAGSDEAKAVARLPHAQMIDLSHPLPPAQGGALVEAARSGQLPVAVEPVAHSIAAPPPLAAPAERAKTAASQAVDHGDYGLSPLAPRRIEDYSGMDLTRLPRRRRKQKILIGALAGGLVAMIVGAAVAAKLMLGGVQRVAEPGTTDAKADAATRPAQTPTAEKNDAVDIAPGPTEKHEERVAEATPAPVTPVVVAGPPPEPPTPPPSAPPLETSEPPNPFADLKKRNFRLALPAVKRAQPTALAKFALANPAALQLAVEGAGYLVPKGGSLQIKQTDNESARLWTLQIKFDQSPSAPTSVAQFSLQNEELFFRWLAESFPELSNCVLRLAADGQEEFCSLREPIDLPEAALDFETAEHEIPIALPDPSKAVHPELLQLRINARILRGNISPTDGITSVTNSNDPQAVILTVPFKEQRAVKIETVLDCRGGRPVIRLSNRGIYQTTDPTGQAVRQDVPLSRKKYRDLAVVSADAAAKAEKNLERCEADRKKLPPPPPAKPNQGASKDPHADERARLTQKIQQHTREKELHAKEAALCRELDEFLATLSGSMRFTLYYRLGKHDVILAESLSNHDAAVEK